MIASLSRDLSIIKVNAGNGGLSVFWGVFYLRSLLKKPTCYKTSEKPSSTELILTSNPRSFQNTCVFKTGL